MAEHDRRGEDHRKGAGDTGQEANDSKDGNGISGRHGGKQDRRCQQRQQRHQPLPSGRPAIGGKHGTDEITDKIGRCDKAGIRRRKRHAADHTGQDRRVGEAPEARGSCHGDSAGSGGGDEVRWGVSGAGEHARVYRAAASVAQSSNSDRSINFPKRRKFSPPLENNYLTIYVLRHSQRYI
ncbi:hypothetical protein ACVIRO_000384 [Rhizobium ruizarguesonis]